jgi:hypothetical protein
LHTYKKETPGPTQKTYFETPQLQDIVIKNSSEKRVAFFDSNMELTKAFTALMSMEVRIPQSMPHGYLHKNNTTIR